MYIGIDVGGTKIQGIVLSKGKIIDSVKEETSKDSGGFQKQILNVCEKFIQKNPGIKGIGIGLPGSLDRKNGKILHLPNLPKIKNISIKRVIEKKFKIPVKIENDGNCMGVAQYFFGEGKGKENVVSLTLGTGIGGGIIINNKLYTGKKGNAGELGHITINSEGYRCNCGSIGCFEEYAASRAIKRFAKEEGLNISEPLEIEKLARKGDKKSKNVYKKFGYYLGVGIGTIIKILDPDVVILSGSLCNAQDLFLEQTKKEIKKRVFFEHCDVKISKLKNAPAIGAACLFLI